VQETTVGKGFAVAVAGGSRASPSTPEIRTSERGGGSKGCEDVRV
jgi:hypothetical protein